MRLLLDGDRVEVLARSLQDADGNVFIEPWGPAVLPAHRVAEHEVGPFSVPLNGWPPGPVVVDEAVVVNDIVPGQVWRISGTWRSGTVEFGSRTLTEHPRAKHFRASPSPTAGQKVKWTSPLDGTQLAALEQLRAEGLVVANRPVKKPDGAVVYTIHSSNPPAVREALNLRPDQAVSIEPSPWTAATVEDTSAEVSNHVEEWHVYSTGRGAGSGDRPFVLTTSVAWLEPELLTLYESTPPGLLELEVWLRPAEEQ